MKFFKRLPVILLAMLGMGMAAAQSSEGYADRMMFAQYRMSGKNTHNTQSDRMTQNQPRQRRFVMPTSGKAYQKNERSQYGAQPGQPGPSDHKSSRMTPDERRALRQQINEANQGIYQKRKNRNTAPYP